MMTRTVILLQEMNDTGPRLSLYEPQTHPKARTGVAFNLDSAVLFDNWSQGALGPNSVESVGRQLYDSLLAQPAIKQELGQAMQAAQDSEHPIYFYLDPAEADRLPWETLHDAREGFLALDRRWPIARLKNPLLTQIKEVYEFSPPLRVLAILSAAGSSNDTRISARAEWDRIYDALNGSGLDFRLRAQVCEEQLAEYIKGLGDQRVEVAFVVDKDDLMQAIASFAPHFLHFFCHGSADVLSCLRVGNRADWEAERDGSIILEANELRQRSDPGQSVWLLTLNCCESAKHASDARNLAGQLVIAGFPAVVGMRERIASDHAHTFCALFYREILRLIARIPADGPPTRIEWASALWQVRATLLEHCRPGELATLAAAGSKEWTMPVIYTRGQPFWIQRRGAAMMSLAERVGLLAQVDALKSQRDIFAARKDVDATVKQKTLEAFEKEIRRLEDELRT